MSRRLGINTLWLGLSQLLCQLYQTGTRYHNSFCYSFFLLNFPIELTVRAYRPPVEIPATETKPPLDPDSFLPVATLSIPAPVIDSTLHHPPLRANTFCDGVGGQPQNV